MYFEDKALKLAVSNQPSLKLVYCLESKKYKESLGSKSIALPN